MPKGRMLNKKISKDIEVAKLSCKTALLYSWCIPHLDVEGRIEASPEIIKGVVMPYRKDFTLSVIQKCIEEIAQAKDLIVYYGNAHKYMQFLGFNKNQTLNKDREAPSEIPAPTPEELQSKSGLNLNININSNISKTGPSATLGVALDKVFKNGLNIYSLINKLKKESKVAAQVPEEVLLKVCAGFDKNKDTIKDQWPWFCRAIVAEWEQYNAQKNITEGKKWKETSISIKEILGINPHP